MIYILVIVALIVVIIYLISKLSKKCLFSADIDLSSVVQKLDILSTEFARSAGRLESIENNTRDFIGYGNQLDSVVKNTNHILGKFEGDSNQKGSFGEESLGKLLNDCFPNRVSYHKKVGSITPDFLITFESHGGKQWGLIIDSKNIDAEVANFKSSIDGARKRVSEYLGKLDSIAPFAIIYLPTEYTYCKVISMPGYVAESFREFKILFAGPATVCMILMMLGYVNSVYDMDFSSMDNVRKLGSYVDTLCNDINTLKDHISNASKKLDFVKKDIGKLRDFNDQMKKGIMDDSTIIQEDK